MYFGNGAIVSDELAIARHKAMQDRLDANRNITCDVCDEILPKVLRISTVKSILRWIDSIYEVDIVNFVTKPKLNKKLINEGKGKVG